MSNDVSTGSAEETGPMSDGEYPKDLYLDILMDLIHGSNNDSKEGSFGITLAVQGQAISGLAISHQVWTHEFGQQLGAANEPLGEAMASIFTAFETRSSEDAARRKNSDEPRPVRRFIHLRDATVFSGGTRLNTGLTRVCLKDVTGWSLGSLDA